MNYTPNQIKVYENASLILSQEITLQNLEKIYNELMELIELFSFKENNAKLIYLKKKQKKIQNTYKPLIKEAKRVYKNTEKRILYNSAKC